MDAGLCGFSIQRLGPYTTQADFDGSPMVTDTMADEDILNLVRGPRDRDEGFIQITQATGDIKADPSLRREARGDRPAARPAQLRGRSARTRQSTPQTVNWLDKTNGKGLRIFGQGVTAAVRVRLHPRRLEPLRRQPAWNEATTGTTEEKLDKLADPEIRVRLKAEIEKPSERLARDPGHRRTAPEA